MKDESKMKKNIRRAKELAKQIMVHHFGSKPLRISHKTSGLSNFVFSVAHPEGNFIVRLSFDPSRLNSFIKEQWTQGRAMEAGVPTTEILEVGNDIIGYPFMISRTVRGQEATFHPNRLSILQEMGHFASLSNSIPTDGFGNTFDWSNNHLSHNAKLSEFLDKELQVETKIQSLEKYKMISNQQIKQLRKIFQEAKKIDAPCLNHGDLRLKNVIVDESGKIQALIDWEDAVSNVIQWELSLALHDLSIDEKEQFLTGYGLSEKKLQEYAPLIKAFNLINYVPKIESLAEAKDSIQLEKYRNRLSGVLDLYCL